MQGQTRCPTMAVPLNSHGCLRRQNSSSLISSNYNRRFSGPCAAAKEDGVPEEIDDWASQEADWIARFEDLKLYVEEHGKLPWKSHLTLGNWTTRQRSQYAFFKAGKLSSMTDNRIAALEAVPGWEWSPNEAAWNSKLEELTQYVEEHGEVPSERHPTLGNWINVQRYDYKTKMARETSPMADDRIAALEELPGWEWSPLETAWNSKLEELKQYVEEHAQVPLEGHPTLGNWISTQRTEFTVFMEGKQSIINPERIAALEAVPGWVWEVDVEAKHQVAWITKINQLREYIAERDGLPSERHPTLGRWIKTQRQQYKKGELRSERMAALESVPQWKWAGR